jgi:hypothetical protein
MTLEETGMSEKAKMKTEDEVVENLTPEQQVEQLRNSLRFEKAKNEALLGEVITLEDEFVNRTMAEFDAVVSDETRKDWRELLLTNRDMAIGLLTELAQAKRVLVAGGDGAGTRRPLHNRSLSRPVAPVAVGGGGGAGTGTAPAASEADDRAAKIRNRAHEISRTDRVPFSAAFRRAEREFAG